MKNLIRITTTVVALIFSNVLFAQQLTQTIKGTVSDKAVKSPLIGANVVILNTNPLKGSVVDDNGNFKIEGVPIGKYALKISFIGFKDVFLNNIVVNSGKEVDLNIEMEENAVQGDEVVVKAKIEKQKALNELAVVSGRAFSVEETQRFAAAINDPARMVTAYAGVVSGDDGNNVISIRGNAPNSLLWRMEGVDIPNPNHFSSVGSSGGGVSILSSQLLTNSDFMTGAFAAEYGNALSGVFDLKMRKGNSEKREYTLQAGVLGFDVATEGPLSKKGSYLINYRYSTLSLLSNLGVNIGGGVTKFQDLSFNISLPTAKFGNFTFFGLGGLSNQVGAGKADSLEWKTNLDKKYSWNFKSNTGAMGMTHSLIFKNAYLKTVIAASGTENGTINYEFQKDYSNRLIYNENHRQLKYTLSSVYNHKFNAQNFLRAGTYINILDFNFKQNEWITDAQKLVEQVNNKGKTVTTNTFAQWQYRPNDAWSINTGLHAFYLTLNKKVSIEPRLSAKYNLSERQSVSVGYGLHSQIQPLGVYFLQVQKDVSSPFTEPNKNLGFTKAHHFVLSYDQMFKGNLHLKTEIYYQSLFNAPVGTAQNSTISLLNLTEGFTAEIFENKGKGRNMGLEVTFEKFMTEGVYFLLSSSLYDSKYQALDGKWRNTLFNGNYANSFVAGKEWDLKRKNRAFSMNLKFTNTGGLRRTPVDLAASILKNETVLDYTKPFELQLPYYLRLDVGVKLKRNFAKMTSTIALDIQNVTNRENVSSPYYDPFTYSIKYYRQAPLIPILSYKVEF